MDKAPIMSDSAYAEKVREAEALRKVAFIGVALSTVAILASVVAVPALYNHLQYVQSEMALEVNFCKVSTC